MCLQKRAKCDWNSVKMAIFAAELQKSPSGWRLYPPSPRPALCYTWVNQFVQHGPKLNSVYNQARSQDLEKGGGLFWKSEKWANNLDSNFHWSWISFRRSVRKLRRNVSESSEIQRFFPPKIRWSKKKKNWEWFFGRYPKFKGFYCPKLGDLQKKKVFTVIETDFSSNFANSDVWGGAIFHFSQKIGLKSTKNMRFCILHKPMGGLEPPRPPWQRYCLQQTWKGIPFKRYIMKAIEQIQLIIFFYKL